MKRARSRALCGAVRCQHCPKTADLGKGSAPLAAEVADAVRSEDLVLHERELVGQIRHVGARAPDRHGTDGVRLLVVVDAVHACQEVGELAANDQDERVGDGEVDGSDAL